MNIAQRVRCVLPSLPRKYFDLASRYDHVIDFTLGDPDLPPPLHVREAGCRAIMEGKTRYSANAGLDDLRRAIAADMESRTGIGANPASEIVVAAGAMEASFLTLYTLLDPGDEVVIHAPYWINYAQVVESLGAKPIFVETRPEDDFQLRVEQLEAVLTERTRLVVLNSPNNPSGAILPEVTLRKIALLAQKYDFLVLSDEIYAMLTYDGKQSPSIRSLPNMKERTIVIDGVSKRFAMTGWRLGWAVGPQELIAQMVKMQENIIACAPLPAQYAAIEALRHPSGGTAIRDEFQLRRNIVQEEIAAIDSLYCHPIPATFYALIDVSATGLDGEEFTLRLLEQQKVAVIPGAAYGGNTYKHLIRIAFTMTENILREGLQRIGRFVVSLKK